jgi:Response regulator receiver domain
VMPSVILIVDDDPMILDLTASMLDELGCRAITCPSASDALRVLQEQAEVTTLLTDVQMPATSGGELAAQARGIGAISISSSPPGGRAWLAGLSCANLSVARSYRVWSIVSETRERFMDCNEDLMRPRPGAERLIPKAGTPLVGRCSVSTDEQREALPGAP